MLRRLGFTFALCLFGAGLTILQAKAEDLLIGHVASMTGDTATFGVSADEGARLALDEINASGGVLGKQVKLLTEDDRSQADEAKAAAQKLITRDKVVAMIGEISSSRTLAIAPGCQEAEIPLLTPGSTNAKVTQIGDYIFRACFIDPFQAASIAKFALDQLHLKRVAVLYPVNSDYGVGLREYFKPAVLAGGGEIVEDQAYTEGKDVDFRAQLTKIKSKNPEAIFISGYYNEAGLIAQQARELGIKAVLLGGDGWDSDKTITIGKDAVEGAYFSNHCAEDEDRPEVKKFVELYKKKYNGKTPDAMAVLGYDAMRMMADAIKRAGNTDGPAIRDALAATKDFPGASGNITMDENRNAKKAIVMLKISGGKFTYAGTVKPD